VGEYSVESEVVDADETVTFTICGSNVEDIGEVLVDDARVEIME